jgi:hypothetical protein
MALRLRVTADLPLSAGRLHTQPLFSCALCLPPSPSSRPAWRLGLLSPRARKPPQRKKLDVIVQLRQPGWPSSGPNGFAPPRHRGFAFIDRMVACATAIQLCTVSIFERMRPCASGAARIRLRETSIEVTCVRVQQRWQQAESTLRHVARAPKPATQGSSPSRRLSTPTQTARRPADGQTMSRQIISGWLVPHQQVPACPAHPTRRVARWHSIACSQSGSQAQVRTQAR